MYFALVCTIGMLKFTGKIDCKENKHTFAQSPYMHMTTSYWYRWSEIILPNHASQTLPHLVFDGSLLFHVVPLFTFLFFHNCEKLTAGKHNHVQVCTASHNNSPHFYFVILLWYFLLFWTFEQIWVGFDTLITVKKLPAGRHNHIDGKPQQQSDDNINSFFHFFHFLSL